MIHISVSGMPLPAIRTFEYASNVEFLNALDSEKSLFEILLDSLCKECLVRVAAEYFEYWKGKNPSWTPSTRVYNILLNGWFRSRRLKKAERLWTEMKRENINPSIVTYGTLIEGYCRMHRVEIAIELIGEMRREGLEPNAIIYNPVIDALGEAGRFKEAFDMMERFFTLESGPTVSTYNSLVKGFCKAGDLEGASKILKMMINRGSLPTMTTYNYFFRHFSKFGKTEEGLNLYTKIMDSGYEPDRLTYHLLVKMLCEQGKLNLLLRILKEMRGMGHDLDLATSTMLIHLLLKVHQFDMAFEEFQAMIHKGLIPQYLTYEKMMLELRNQGRTKMAQNLSDLMASIPHSKNLPNTYVAQVDTSRARKMYVMHKAEAMSDILKTCNNPRRLAKNRNPLENVVSTANRLIDDISTRVNSV